MKYIISGTNRPGSRSLEVATLLKAMYESEGERVEVIDLSQIGLQGLSGSEYGSDQLPAPLREAIAKVTTADGLIIVCPEYNGSMPGALKYFIDFWKYPDSFEYRPIAFVGLGGRFGGLRPVEHLQGVFGYRNAYCFPVRVFLSDVWNLLKDGKIQDPRIVALLQDQVKGFIGFCRALRAEGLDANSIRAARG